MLIMVVYSTHTHTQKNDVPTVRALLALGADLNAVNDFDQTPLDMATQNLVCMYTACTYV